MNQPNVVESALNRTTTDTTSTVSIGLKPIESCDKFEICHRFFSQIRRNVKKENSKRTSLYNWLSLKILMSLSFIRHANRLRESLRLKYFSLAVGTACVFNADLCHFLCRLGGIDRCIGSAVMRSNSVEMDTKA